MPDWTLVDRSHILSTLAEYDRLGSREFLSRYRFGRSTAYTLWHGGQEYDPLAVLGVAYLQATGRTATRDELNGSEDAGVRVLRGFGLDVVVDEEELEAQERRRHARPVASPAAAGSRATRSTPAARTSRAASPKSTRVKPGEAPVKVCPTCHMALPATGICDNCD